MLRPGSWHAPPSHGQTALSPRRQSLCDRRTRSAVQQGSPSRLLRALCRGAVSRPEAAARRQDGGDKRDRGPAGKLFLLERFPPPMPWHETSSRCFRPASNSPGGLSSQPLVCIGSVMYQCLSAGWLGSAVMSVFWLEPVVYLPARLHGT